MAKTMIDPGMPRKVLHKAHQLGVHNDCLVSGDLCEQCDANVTLAFDFFYGDSRNETELMTNLIEDFKRDIEEDLHG